uniref:Uncharacterized protein n=1 Tax=Acrobeloides nanus TaxID=290746 RepID=A0A914BUF2_9BILA
MLMTNFLFMIVMESNGLRNLITIEVIAAFQLPYFEAIYTFIPQNSCIYPGSSGIISSNNFPKISSIDTFYRIIAPDNTSKIQIHFTQCENNFVQPQCITSPFDFHMSTRICSFLAKNESLIDEHCICDCNKILGVFNDKVYETNDLVMRIFIPKGRFSFIWRAL